MIQEFIEGDHIKFTGICLHGQLVYHNCYRYRKYQGTPYFKELVKLPVVENVKKIVTHLKYHGPIAFDFIVTENKIYFVKCVSHFSPGIGLVKPIVNMFCVCNGIEKIQTAHRTIQILPDEIISVGDIYPFLSIFWKILKLILLWIVIGNVPLKQFVKKYIKE